MPVQGLAAVAKSFGKPLVLEQMTFPDPGPTDVLVKMTATGLCHTDLHAINGDWPIQPALPFVPGHEGVGAVVAVGSQVRDVHEGDRVGLPWLHNACGRCDWCLTGWESLCPNAAYGGYTANGSFSEYALSPAAFAAPIPAGLSDIVAAPILCAGVTTWKAIKEAELQAGEWLAVSGIGGLGHLAVQYAKQKGLLVAAIDVDQDKLELAKICGADLVVNADEVDPAEELQKLIGGAHGAVVTAPSCPAFTQAINMVRRKGNVVLVGLPPGDFPLSIFEVVLKRITIRGSLVGTRKDLAEALAMAGRLWVKPHIQQRPFAQVNDAIHQLAAGQVEGRIVLTF